MRDGEVSQKHSVRRLTAFATVWAPTIDKVTPDAASRTTTELLASRTSHRGNEVNTRREEILRYQEIHLEYTFKDCPMGLWRFSKPEEFARDFPLHRRPVYPDTDQDAVGRISSTSFISCRTRSLRTRSGEYTCALMSVTIDKLKPGDEPTLSILSSRMYTAARS